MAQFKRLKVSNKALSERKFTLKSLESSQKSKIRQMFLDNLQVMITNHSKKGNLVKGFEADEEKNIEEFANYVKWLSNEGLKQYAAFPLKNMTLKLKNYN